MARKIIGREKRYVEVDVRFEPDGHLRPLAIRFGPEQVYQIDKIKDVSRRARRGGRCGGPVCLRNPWAGNKPLDGEGPLVCGSQAGGRSVTISTTQANAASAEKVSPPRGVLHLYHGTKPYWLSACGRAIALAWPWAAGNGIEISVPFLSMFIRYRIILTNI